MRPDTVHEVVAVVQVWKVSMAMDQAIKPVCVDVGFARRVVRRVRMLMVRIVRMGMLMAHRLVNMLVRMSFGEMQP